MPSLVGRPLQLPSTEGCLKVFIDVGPRPLPAALWEQRFFVYLMWGRTSPINWHQLRAQEKRSGIIEKIIERFRLSPDSAFIVGDSRAPRGGVRWSRMSTAFLLRWVLEKMRRAGRATAAESVVRALRRVQDSLFTAAELGAEMPETVPIDFQNGFVLQLVCLIDGRLEGLDVVFDHDPEIEVAWERLRERWCGFSNPATHTPPPEMLNI